MASSSPHGSPDYRKRLNMQLVRRRFQSHVDSLDAEAQSEASPVSTPSASPGRLVTSKSLHTLGGESISPPEEGRRLSLLGMVRLPGRSRSSSKSSLPESLPGGAIQRNLVPLKSHHDVRFIELASVNVPDKLEEWDELSGFLSQFAPNVEYELKHVLFRMGVALYIFPDEPSSEYFDWVFSTRNTLNQKLFDLVSSSPACSVTASTFTRRDVLL